MKADANATATDTYPDDAGNVVDATTTDDVAATDTNETDDADMNIAATSDAIWNWSLIPVHPLAHCPLSLLLESMLPLTIQMPVES